MLKVILISVGIVVCWDDRRFFILLHLFFPFLFEIVVSSFLEILFRAHLSMTWSIDPTWKCLLIFWREVLLIFGGIRCYSRIGVTSIKLNWNIALFCLFRAFRWFFSWRLTMLYSPFSVVADFFEGFYGLFFIISDIVEKGIFEFIDWFFE